VSKRSKRRQDPRHEARPAGPGEVPGQPVAERAGRRVASDWNLGLQLAFLVAVFAVVVLVAELAGAANLGVALGVGQVAFAIAVVYLLVRR
jgi:Flp pilus assembly protein TadB